MKRQGSERLEKVKSMALVSCKECGKKIAHDALRCPSCGTNDPHPKKKKKKGCLGRFVLLVIAIVVLYVVLAAMGIIS